MSDYLRYKAIQREVEQLNKLLQEIENQEDFKKDLEFLQRLDALAAEYSLDRRGVALFLQEIARPIAEYEVNAAAGSTSSSLNKRQRKRNRPARIYRNPFTGEVIRTRNPQNRELKQWRAKYGPDVVASWGKIL